MSCKVKFSKLKISQACVVATAVLTVVGCSWGSEDSESKVRLAKVTRSDKEVKVPTSLVRKVEDLYIAKVRSEDSENSLSDSELKVRIPRRFLALDVMLENDSRQGALGGDWKFSLPRGGGVIDFTEFVPKGNGRFRVKVAAMLEVDGDPLDSGLKVYFVSNSIRRDLVGKTYGSGCEKYMDMTQFYYDKLLSGGLEVSALRERYVSVLAGTFFFVYPTAEGVHLASLSFEDSRHPGLQCRKL